MLGIKTTIYTNQAQPSQWAAGVNQAIAQKPDLIMLQGAPDPRVLQPQLIAAKKAGIPVLVTHFFEESDPMPPNVTALVRVQFNQAARLEADWTIVDSGGKANAVVLTSNEVPIAKGMLNAMKQEFSKCSGCKLTIVNVPIPDWATKIQTEVQSALVKDPGVNYVIPFVDGMASFAAVRHHGGGQEGQGQDLDLQRHAVRAEDDPGQEHRRPGRRREPRLARLGRHGSGAADPRRREAGPERAHAAARLRRDQRRPGRASRRRTRPATAPRTSRRTRSSGA